MLKIFYECLTPFMEFGTLALQSQKTTAEPRNSNHLSLAQNTPIACFFMRSAHAPQERLARPSMVACSGKGSALCCFPVMTVFEPVTRYRQQASKLQAVTSNQIFTGVTQMYQFIFALMRTPKQSLKIRILADNEQQARARFTHGDTLLFVGRINQNPRKNNRTLASRFPLSAPATQGGVYA